MIKSRPSSYLVWVYIAYGFYILLGLSWLYFSFMNSSRFNPYAAIILIIFGGQCYFRHLLTNLILGIVAMLGSIFMFLQALNSAILASRMGSLMFFDKFLVGITTFSILMSGVLIFSFMKLNLKD